MPNWRHTTWGDEISLEYGKGLRGYAEVKGAVRVFGTNGPVGWTDTSLAEGPGVILGRKGAYRGVHYSPDPFFVIDTAYYAVPKTELDMRWLYYAMVYHELGKIDDGSPIPSTTRAAVYPREFDVPSIDEQRAIARVLGALDDKIEQNRRMSAALERLARAVFRAWFVDFEPVKAKAARAAAFPSMPQPIFDTLPTRLVDSELGPVPERWAVDDYCEINARSVRKGEIEGEIEYVDISAVTAGRLEEVQRLAFGNAPSRARRRIRHGDTIWSCVRPNRRSYLFIHSPPDRRIVSTGFAVLSPSEFGASYLYQLTTQPEFVEYLVSNADGSAYPAVRPEHFARAPVVIPSKDMRDAFESLTMPLRDLSAALDRESQSLAKTRDYLLPKLLSGAVRVREAEKLVGEVV